jgi:citrate lyase beta subunit
MLNLPKPGGVASVLEAVEAIVAAERRNGVLEPVKLLLNIESPQALREATMLALASDRVCGLQLGLGDLFEPLGINRYDENSVRQVLFAVRMAAGEAGIAAYDGAFANVADPTGFEAEALMAKNLGFTGKSCIHPSQIALANAAFLPNKSEIEKALAVLQSIDGAQSQGMGAYLVNGRMIDAPFIRRAQEIVTQARHYRLIV